MPYTFAIRGVDAEGNASEWEQIVGAASEPGTYLLDNSGRDRRWRTTSLSGTQVPRIAALTVEPNAAVHVALTNSEGPRHRAARNSYLRRAPAGRFRSATFPATKGYADRLDTSPVAPGLIAMADRNCVSVRDATGAWTEAGCFTIPDPGSYDFGVEDVYGIQLDNKGNVHVVFSGERATEKQPPSGFYRIYYASDPGVHRCC